MITQILSQIRLAFLVVALSVFATTSFVQAQKTLHCSRERIVGFDDCYTRATKKLPKQKTSKLGETEIFVTTKGDLIYLHSNYAPEGLRFPFKVSSNEGITKFERLVDYLVDPRATTSESSVDRAIHQVTVRKAYEKFITIYVEERVFKHLTYRNLDFGNAANVKVVGSDGIARLTKTIERTDGSKKRIVELRPNQIYADVKTPDMIGMMRRFDAKSFKRDDVRVLPLIQNQATTSKIAELIPSRNQIAFDFSSPEVLSRELSKNKGTTVFVIGHIPEGSGRLIVENTAGKEVFSIPITQLEEMAKANNSSVIILGCKSAEAATSGGTVNEINSVVAVERLNAAMNSQNYGKFIEQLAAPNLVLVADEALLNGANRRVVFTYRDALKIAGPALVAGSLVVVYQALDEDRKERPRNSQRRSRRTQ